MTEIRTKLLFRLSLNVDFGAHHVVGPTPFGRRRVAPVAGGSFEGPQLSGIVLPGGTDWVTEDAGGSWFRMDVRLPLRTHDGDLLTMAYQGFRSGPPDVLAKVARGETVAADSYYYRVAGFFETASPKLVRLNTLLFVANGWRISVGPEYDVFEVL